MRYHIGQKFVEQKFLHQVKISSMLSDEYICLANIFVQLIFVQNLHYFGQKQTKDKTETFLQEALNDISA